MTAETTGCQGGQEKWEPGSTRGKKVSADGGQGDTRGTGQSGGNRLGQRKVGKNAQNVSTDRETQIRSLDVS